MADERISALTAATTAAGANELPINEAGVTKKVTVTQIQNFLGLTSASSSAAAALNLAEDTDNGTNKITLTAPSAIASDKTITLPDATDTLVGKATTDTLTNKTLTSPVLSDAVPTADGSIGFDRTNEDLVVGDGAAGQLVHMGAWKTWTPTFANFTKGSATITAKYSQVGKTITARLSINLAADSSMGTAPIFTLPVTSVAVPTSVEILGNILIIDVTYGVFSGACRWNSTTTALMQYWSPVTTRLDLLSITATVPMTWTTGDIISTVITYEAA